MRLLAALGVVVVRGRVALALFCRRRHGLHRQFGDRQRAWCNRGSDRDVDQVIAQMVSVFENGTPEIQYAYIEDLDDGRGYTAGRAGFCTACGDLLTVVKTTPRRFRTTRSPSTSRPSPASPRRRTTPPTGSTASRRLAHRRRGSRVPPGAGPGHGRPLHAPARKLAEDNGVRSALGLAILVDTAVQQGTDNDPDGLPSMVQKTNADRGRHTRRRHRRDHVAAGLPHRPPHHPGEPQFVGHPRGVARVRRPRRRPRGLCSTRATSTSRPPSPSTPSATPRRSARTSTSGGGDDLLRSVCRRAAAAGRPLPSRSRRGRSAQRAAWRG